MKKVCELTIIETGKYNIRKGETIKYEVFLGYEDIKTNIPHLLVQEIVPLSEVIKPHVEIKILNEKEKVFLDNLEHTVRGTLHERADITKPGTEFKYKNKSYRKLADDEIKKLCKSTYKRSGILF